MQTRELFRRLSEHNMKRNELRQFCSEHFDKIIKNLDNEISNHDIMLITNIFTGLNPSDIERKAQVVDKILQVLRSYTEVRKENSEPDSKFVIHCRDIKNRVCLELPRLPPNYVVRWCNESVQTIEKDDDVNMIWSDILPECLNIVSSLNSVEYKGEWITGEEYQTLCVKRLLECSYKEKQLVPITAMFKHLKLSNQENKQLVTKICSYIEDIKPDSLPPLVYQLLKMCKQNNYQIVLAHLSHYFNLHYSPYKNQEPELQDSEATTVDDAIVQYNSATTSSCLSMCLYYVTQVAAEPEAVRRHLRDWPATQLLREPFILNLALAMADKGGDFETTCLDVIKKAIKQSKMDNQKKMESAQIASVVPPDMDVGQMLLAFTSESMWWCGAVEQRTLSGLVGAGLALVEGGAGVGAGAGVGGAGVALLTRLVRAPVRLADRTVACLGARLAVDSPHRRRYAECLRVMCKRAPSQMEQCAQLSSIVEGVQPAGEYRDAAAVYHAVHPLVNYSARVRDTLVMVCRKGLYARESVHRCLALCGMLTVLKHMRISEAATQEPDEASQESYLSQLPLDVHATQQGSGVTSRKRNQTICLDIVSILRRCLGQDADVKELLYSRWYDCVKDKPSLHESILEMLDEHLSMYLREEDDVPLLLDECVQMRGETAVLVEPLGHLLYLIAQFLRPSETSEVYSIFSQSTSADLTRNKLKLKNVLDELSKRDFNMQIDMENLNVTDSSPEAKVKSIKVQQVLHVYEALIAHQILQWTPANGNADAVLRLFKAYMELVDNTKSSTKSSKKLSKLNETQRSTKSNRSQTERKKGSSPCLWDLKLCYRVMELLYSAEVEWSTLEQRLRVRTRELHRCAARRVRSALEAHAQPPAAPAPAPHAPAADIAALLYDRCITRFQEVCDFDEESALVCVEVFHACLKLLYSPKYNVKSETFLAKITGAGAGAEAAAEALEALHGALRGAARAHAQALAEAAATLLRASHNTVMRASPRLARVVTNLEEYVKTSQEECFQLLAQLLASAASYSCEAPLLDALIERIVHISQDEEPAFPWIKPSNVKSAWSVVSAHLQARMACARYLLARVRTLDAACALAAPATRDALHKELGQVVNAAVLQLRLLARWVASAAGVGAAAGGVQLVARLYELLTALVRKLDAASARKARLDLLLERAGDPLTSAVHRLRARLEGGEGAAGGRRGRGLMPKLLSAADRFRSHVLLFDPKRELNYEKYLTLRITQTTNMEVDDNEGSGDQSERLSDADTEIIDVRESEEEDME